MTAEPLLAPGGLRIRNKNNNTTIGFAFTEPTPMGQLQRWILWQVPGEYTLEKWTPVQGFSLEQHWKAWAKKKRVSAWSEDPQAGLWVENGFYVVARSVRATQLSALKGAFVDAGSRVARRDAGAAGLTDHAESGAPAAGAAARRAEDAAPGSAKPVRAAQERQGRPGVGLGNPGIKDIATPDPDPIPQLVVGDRCIYVEQSQDLRGRCMGLGYPEKLSTFFETTECWLLYPGYQAAGGSGVKTVISLKGWKGIKTADQWNDLVSTEFTAGCAHETTTCSWYHGAAPPPPDFL
ncbi:uncharacterized protein SOCE26_104010 [Sorangium cellulosum]|uniref:Uncharacterized protein n=1 Tax=Sorangium cellulosum TaxID=56 RepID=A0A2L0FB73_SORCE|nr:hypothetical protein [Sorangium cellulosum]AUX48858.1 uncharacterized protein SOCE26_104010 [Sorangium cellulosum]